MVQEIARGYYKKHAKKTDKAVAKEFGRKLEARLIEKKLNQSDLARMVGAERSSISGYVRGLWLPRPPALEELAKALDCSSLDLLPQQGDNAAADIPETGPIMEIKELDSQRFAIRLNRVTSRKIAMQIIALLMTEDKR